MNLSTIMPTGCLLLAWLISAFWVQPAAALQLDPLSFTSLGSLNTTSDIVINGDTLQLTGGASFIGITDPVSHASVFAFDSIQTGTVSIIGATPLALLSKGNITLSGPVTVSVPDEVQIAAAGTLMLTSISATAPGSGLYLFAGTFMIGPGQNIPSPIILPPPTLPVLGPGGIAVVPLPATAVLFATGAVVAGSIARWRRRECSA